jgi:hypothetical protein
MWDLGRAVDFLVKAAARNMGFARCTVRLNVPALSTIDVLFTGENDRPPEKVVTGVPRELGRLSARRSG